MRMIVEGKVKIEDLENVVKRALYASLEILDKEDPEITDELDNNCEESFFTNIVIDCGFKLKDQEEPVTLTANHGGVEEMLTFIYDAPADDAPLNLKQYNNETSQQESFFTDEDRGVFGALNGTQVVMDTIPTDNLIPVFKDKVGSLIVRVFELPDKCVVKYYDIEGCGDNPHEYLIQETECELEHMQFMIDKFTDIVGR